MIREDILAMPAGRELDALVAGKVMGYEIHETRYKVNGYTAYLADFKPSTDISAAWEVLGKFMSYQVSGITIHTCKLWKSLVPKSWECQAKTAPEAICKAALLSVLEESP